MVYTPDGSKLLVGSHDNYIYIYETDTYKKLAVSEKKNASAIISIEVHSEGKYFRTTARKNFFFSY
jgi:hypothetical protein